MCVPPGAGRSVMRVRYPGKWDVPAHAVKVGDRLQERRTGEVRTVTMLARTLAEISIHFDDETYVEAGIFDTATVVQKQKGRSDADG